MSIVLNAISPSAGASAGERAAWAPAAIVVPTGDDSASGALPRAMRAIVCPRYGGPEVLRIQEVATPQPGDDDVLIEVAAVSLNAGDWRLMRGDPFLVRLMYGLRGPKHAILGIDVAGRVVKAGKNVARFRIGDHVFGDLTTRGFGAFAEYAVASQDALAALPSAATHIKGAAIPTAGVTALQALRKAKVRAHDEVLVTGASGGVGSFAVQIAKAQGAVVTGLCTTEKADFVRSLGASRVIDYTRDDFLAEGPRYDVILDAAAYRSPFATQRALRRGGRYVLVGGGTWPMMQAMVTGKILNMEPSAEDLATMGAWLESGVVEPAVDRVFPFEEVAAAIRYLEEGRARGKVVLEVRRAEQPA